MPHIRYLLLLVCDTVHVVGAETVATGRGAVVDRCHRRVYSLVRGRVEIVANVAGELETVVLVHVGIQEVLERLGILPCARTVLLANEVAVVVDVPRVGRDR